MMEGGALAAAFHHSELIHAIHERQRPPPAYPVKAASAPDAGAYDVLTLRPSDRRGLAPGGSQHVTARLLLRCTNFGLIDSQNHLGRWEAQPDV